VQGHGSRPPEDCAEAAVAGWFADRRHAVGVRAMTDGRRRRLFWRVADDLDYLVTLASLRILDALAGPEPETPGRSEAEAGSGADTKGVPQVRR
jgi:hypothetical protein